MMKSLILSMLLISVQAFAPKLPTQSSLTTLSANSIEQSESPFDGILSNIQMRVRVGQESQAAGFGVKQILTDMIAGEYDKEATDSKIESEISSAPCVMFTWESSPSCKKAVEAFETIGANVKIVRLDDPWSEGNPIRASLGRKVGKSSVPCIFVNGNYIGGFDGGVGDDAPGLVNLAFKGELRKMLEDAGAMK